MIYAFDEDLDFTLVRFSSSALLPWLMRVLLHGLRSTYLSQTVFKFIALDGGGVRFRSES
jgi:hypothetical protein